MKKLIFPRSQRHPAGDGKRLVESFARLGYEVSVFDAEDAWKEYSEIQYSAGWVALSLSDDNLEAQCAHLVELWCLVEEK